MAASFSQTNLNSQVIFFSPLLATNKPNTIFSSFHSLLETQSLSWNLLFPRYLPLLLSLIAFFRVSELRIVNSFIVPKLGIGNCKLENWKIGNFKKKSGH